MAKLCVNKNGETNVFYLLSESECAKPRLAIKSNDGIYYLPLYTDTPPTGVNHLLIKQATTIYYALSGATGLLYPSITTYPSANTFPAN